MKKFFAPYVKRCENCNKLIVMVKGKDSHINAIDYMSLSHQDIYELNAKQNFWFRPESHERHLCNRNDGFLDKRYGD